jgi:hypothetical protein
MRLYPLFFVALACIACDEAADESSTPAAPAASAVVVEDGKADNYFSSNGQEYDVRGVDRFDLMREEGEDDDAYNARALVFAEERFKAITFFLNAYVKQKSRKDSNFEYGGFRTTVRQRSIKASDLLMIEEGTFSVTFETEIAGPNSLARMMDAKEVDDGLWRFELIMPQLGTSEVENGSYSRTYKKFDGEAHPEDQRDVLTLDFEVGQNSLDAYPRYFDMVADDDKLDILILVGGDYNDKRYDLLLAEDLFHELQDRLGFKAPVDDWMDLDLDSGPFTRTINTVYGEFPVEVYVVHPGMAVEEPQLLIESFKEHASKRDIIVYDGHAGYDASYSGIVVTYQPRTAIPADAFKDMDLPEKPQLFFLNGCKTYSVYPDALLAHPKKTAENLDIISTVNFSWLSQMIHITTDFLDLILKHNDTDGLHEPVSFQGILSGLNRNRSWDVIYGVHGADDNPHQSPWADDGAICQACSSDADCYGGDALCVNGGCGFGCTSDLGCPADFACKQIAVDGVITTKQCVPSARSCR